MSTWIALSVDTRSQRALAFAGLFPRESRTAMPTPDSMSVTLLDENDVERIVERMAKEIVERAGGVESLVLLGIHRRGVEISARIRTLIEREAGRDVAAGAIDITFYRDDLARIGPRPVVGESELPMDGIDDRTVVIVDDVFFTGRTARAAINELMDWGRPARILFCVLVDRDGRELPIRPDVVGRRLSVLPSQKVDVRVPEIDGQLAVCVSHAAGSAS